jgi:hypothetical protein
MDLEAEVQALDAAEAQAEAQVESEAQPAEVDGAETPMTQAELQAKLEAAKEEARAAAREEALNAANEAQRLAEMSDAERAEDKLSKREAELAKREAELAQRELVAVTESELAAVGLPTELATHIAHGDAEAVKGSISALDKAFKKAVSEGVKKSLETPAPKGAPTQLGGTQVGQHKSSADILNAARIIK